MDKSIITGLVLIAILLVGFSFLGHPNKKQLAAQQRYYNSIAQVQQRKTDLKAKAGTVLVNNKEAQTADSTALFLDAFQGTDSQVTIQNNLTELTVATEGGRTSSATLKEYMGQDKKIPVTLFSRDDASMNLLFYSKKETIQAEDYYFKVVDYTDSTAIMRLSADSASYIDFKYSMRNGTYLADFTIDAVGMANKLASTKYVDIEWSQYARQIEKGYTHENRLSELTYKIIGDGTDYLSAGKNDEKEVAERLDWIAFKNQFFPSVFLADADFERTELSSKVETQGGGYIKDYSAEMSTVFDPTGEKTIQLFFYFGPNHYKTLIALDRGRTEKWELNRLVYLGWPLIRWINKWFTINIFDWLSSWGSGIGIVLLLMTLIVRAVAFPATWKTYISSAKMCVLKPKIDEIGKKYPKQEDAMKKQQEVMRLYSQYGVSPMGGCLPMLIQPPTLVALFTFMPSAIELRQQSFPQADDLSTYDAFTNFSFHILFLGSHLSLFCLLMTVTNALNTKFMMQQQDMGANPQMAAVKWMLCLMPVIFLSILNDHPSGLNYYYFISTLISVMITLIVCKTMNEEALLAELEAKKKDPKKMKETGFAARPEAMQKQQERMMKEKQNRK